MEDDNLIVPKRRRIIAVSVGLVLALVVVAVVVSVVRFFSDKNEKELSSQLEIERGAIEETLKERFRFMDYLFDVEDVILLEQGKKAAVLLNVAPAVKYRAILAKDDGEWSVLGLPDIVLYYDDFPDVSRDVIRVANDMRAK